MRRRETQHRDGRARWEFVALALLAVLIVGLLSTAVCGGEAPPAARAAGHFALEIGAASDSTTGWSELTNSGASAPGLLAGQGMTYDPALGEDLLFGGCDSGHYWNDSCTAVDSTWVFANGNWTELHPANSPSARTAPLMVYDAAVQSVVLFGGGAGTPSYASYNDTWQFDGTDWNQVATSSAPTGGTSASMAYDPAISAIVLFDSGATQTVGDTFNATWEFSGDRWTQVSNGTGPSPRAGEMMEYDPLTQSVLLFGGTDCPTPHACTGLNDLWSFSDGTWTQLPDANPPDVRDNAVFVFDPTLNGSLLFGGHLSYDFYDDTWLYANETWQTVSTSASPPAEAGGQAVFDPARGQVVYYGGYTYPPDTFYDNTWLLGEPHVIPPVHNGTSGTNGTGTSSTFDSFELGFAAGALPVAAVAGAVSYQQASTRRAGEELLRRLRENRPPSGPEL